MQGYQIVTNATIQPHLLKIVFIYSKLPQSRFGFDTVLQFSRNNNHK